MIKTLDRYIVKAFTQSLLLWFVVVLALRIVFDLLANMDEFTEGDPSSWMLISNVIVFYSSHALEYIAEMGGIIVVVSAAFTIVRMQNTNELTAMLASGVSLYRVVWPIICAAMVMSLIIVIDREICMPSIRSTLVLKPDEVGKEDTTKMNVYMIVDSNATCWYANEYQPGQKIMKYPVVILRDPKTYRYAAHASGRQATYDKNNKGWAITDGQLLKVGRKGKNVWRRVQTSNSIYTTIGPETFVAIGRRRWLEKHSNPLPPGQRFVIKRIEDSDKHYNMTIYADKFIPGRPYKGKFFSGKLINPKFLFYNDKGGLIATIMGDSAKWVPGKVSERHWQLEKGKLLINSEMTPDEVALKQSGRWKDYLTSAELTDMMKLQGATDISSVRMTKFIRVVEPFNNLIMLLLGLPFILSRQRNIKASAMYCILTVGIFYVFVYGCRYIGMPDALSAFLPIMVFGPISILMLDSIQT